VAANLWVRDQGVAGVMVDHDDLKQILGQTGLDTQLAQAQTEPVQMLACFRTQPLPAMRLAASTRIG